MTSVSSQGFPETQKKSREFPEGRGTDREPAVVAVGSSPARREECGAERTLCLSESVSPTLTFHGGAERSPFILELMSQITKDHFPNYFCRCVGRRENLRRCFSAQTTFISSVFGWKMFQNKSWALNTLIFAVWIMKTRPKLYQSSIFHMGLLCFCVNY